MKHLLLILPLLASLNASAGLVGDFSDIHNLPGHIDLNPRSLAFKGPAIRNPDFQDGVITETPSAFLKKFFKDGRIDVAKIEAVISELKVVQENARIAYCQSEQAEDQLSQKGCDQGFPREKLAKKWKKKSVNVAYTWAMELLREAMALSADVTEENINSPKSQPFLEAFFDAFEVYQGVMAESSQMGRYSSIVRSFQMVMENFHRVQITRGRPEAANLLRPDGDGRVFYSPEELEELKEQGQDISLLDPPDSGFWKKPKKGVRAFNTIGYDGQEKHFFKKVLEKDEVEELLQPSMPVDVIYDLAAPKETGETPKFIVKHHDATFKVKFTTDRTGRRSTLSIGAEAMRLVRGMEVNTETVVNNLAAAMGFAVDGTYHKDVVRLHFSQKVLEELGFDEAHRRLLTMFGNRYKSDYNVNSALRDVKVDPRTGQKYLELRNCQLERKSDDKTDMNIGFFVRKGLGKSLKREHRAFALFLAWVWDVDSKDANDALKLVPYKTDDGKKRYKVVMSNSDMGSTLASNRPNFFNFRLIRDSRKDETGRPEFIRFNYLRIYPNDLMDAITFDDARWMGRLMGQLSEEQIFSAFLGAGYSELVARYYTGLLLKKRNELLDALGLFNEGFSPAPEFMGTISGSEEFFKNGFLTDPENKLWNREREPFPPFWGAGFLNMSGEPQEYFFRLMKIKLLTTAGDIIYNSGLSRLSLSNEGLKFTEIIMPDRSKIQECLGRCFFQGLNAGVDGFVPWRFIVENPDLEAKEPFLVVDIFRLGFFAGGHVQGSFGVDIPGAPLLGIGGNHYQISEFIKVRPVENIMELFNEKSELLKMPKLTFKTARAQVIEDLKDNEYLIQTHYVGLKARARLSLYNGLTIPISPSVTFRGDLLRANRVTYLGKSEGQLLVGWDKLREFNANTRLNLLDYIVRLPVLEAEQKRLSTVQRTFAFDRRSPVDREVLFNNVNKIVPSDIPEEYALARRSTFLRQRGNSVGLFNLFRRTSLRRSVSVEYEDRAKDYIASNTGYTREINRRSMNLRLSTRESSYKISAGLNAASEVFAKIRLDGSFENVTKAKFKKLLKKYTPMLPDNFIQFDPEAVAQNFGTLDLKIETIFPEKGLKDIFRQELRKDELCLVYAQVHHFDWSTDDCTYLSRLRTGLLRVSKAKRRFLKLWKNYDNGRLVFWELLKRRTETGQKGLEGMLKKIVDLMTDNGDYDYRTMNLFIALAQKANYYRRASMLSSLEAFPGQTGTISQDRDSEGDYVPGRSMTAERPEEEFILFMDRLHQAIQQMFYNEQYVFDKITS